MSLKDMIFAAGVVGCGGAGFPTHVKLSGSVEHLIVNGAECEPLLRTDRYIMTAHARELVTAAQAVSAELGTKKCTIALKQTYKSEIAALSAAIDERRSEGAAVELFFLTSFYPAGDEQTLVHEVTGKTVPPAGIPLDVGAVVSNAATMLCIYDAMNGKPFTDKYLTVTGEVKEPTVLHVPLGTSFSQCIDLAGGAKCDEYIVVSGGPMMGKPMTHQQALGESVTKTTSGLLVLKADSAIGAASRVSVAHMLNRARSACIQCSFCTQMCPRNLMGHPIEPHKIMRKMALCSSIDGLLGDRDIKNAALCCECGVCEVYACPMGLQPRKINAMIKRALGEAGIRYEKGAGAGDESPMREFRKIPSKRAAIRAGVAQYYDYSITSLKHCSPERVKLPLRQHIGAPCEPTVKTGDTVKKGELIAKCPEQKLGANLHASIDGTVTVSDTCITIEK